MNKLWEIELDLLDKLKSICKKHGLQYFASSGTLLGAVRHKGFIPWDDDIDIFLMWPDYKKLMEVAPRECQAPYFFQSIYTEKCAMPSACRLRRDDTTGFTKWELQNGDVDYHKGIFIDIFPLFAVPDTEEERRRQKEQVFFYWEAIHGYDAVCQAERGRPNPDYEKYIPSYERYRAQFADGHFDPIRMKERYLEACAITEGPTRELGATSSKCHAPNLMWESAWFESFVELPFENTSIPCPVAYEKVLEKQYGDWRIPVHNGAKHEMIVVDTEGSWRDLEMQRFETTLQRE